jgi:hypothetical protein
LLGYRKLPIKDDIRKAACWNASNWQFIDSHERLSSSQWNNIFLDNSNNITVNKLNVLYEFFPFESSMYCHISAPSAASGNGPVKVVLSDQKYFSDPRASFYTTPLILTRGIRLLQSTS